MDEGVSEAVGDASGGGPGWGCFGMNVPVGNGEVFVTEVLLELRIDCGLGEEGDGRGMLRRVRASERGSGKVARSGERGRKTVRA